MAINPNTIKALFSKLKPAARAVAPVADDIAKGVANYGDDALRAMDKVDDLTPSKYEFEFTNPFGQTVSADHSKPGIWNIDGKLFHDISEGDLFTNQSVLKQELLNKRTDRAYLDAIPREGSDVKFLGDAVQLFDHSNREMFERGPGFTVNLPYRMPSEDLVLDRNTTLRPHKNTALGRWYADRQADFDFLVANAPDYDYSDILRQVDEDSAAYDDWLAKLSKDNETRFRLNGMDSTLLNGKKLGHFNDVPEYVSSLANPGVWKTSTPLQQDDTRLNNLYAQLKQHLDVGDKHLSWRGKWPYNVLSRNDTVEAMDEIDRIRKALTRPDQIKFEF